MNTDNKLFKKEGYKLIGAGFEVYNELGSGLIGFGNRVKLKKYTI